MRATYYHDKLPPRQGEATKTKQGYSFVADDGFTLEEVSASAQPEHNSIVIEPRPELDVLKEKLSQAEAALEKKQAEIAELEKKLAEIEDKTKPKK